MTEDDSVESTPRIKENTTPLEDEFPIDIAKAFAAAYEDLRRDDPIDANEFSNLVEPRQSELSNRVDPPLTEGSNHAQPLPEEAPNRNETPQNDDLSRPESAEADSLFRNQPFQDDATNDAESPPSESLKAQVLSAQAEILSLKRELLNLKTADSGWQLQQLQSENKALRDSSTSLKKELFEAQHETDSMRRKVIDTELKLEEANVRHTELEGVVKNVKEACEAKIHKLMQEMDMTHHTHASREKELTKEIESMTQQLALANQRNLQQESLIQSASASYKESCDRVEKLEREMSDMEKTLKEKETTISDLSQAHTALRLEIERVKTQAVTPQSKRELLASEALQKLQALTEEHESLKAHYDTLIRRNEEDRRSLRRSISTSRDASEEVLELRRRCLGLEKRLETLSDESSQQRETIHKLEQQLCDTKVDLARERRAKNSLQDQLAQVLAIESPEESVKDLLTENQELREAVRTLQRDAERSAQRAAQELESQIVALEGQIRSYGEEKTRLIEELDQKKAKAEARQEELVRHITRLEEEVRVARSIEEGFETEKRKWLEEINTYQQRLQQAAQQIENLTCQINQMAGQRMEAVLKVAAKEAEVKFLHGQIEREESRSKALGVSIDEHLQTRLMLQQELTQTQQRVHKQQCLIDAFDSERVKYEHDLEEERWSRSLCDEENGLLKKEIQAIAQQRVEHRAALELQIIRFQNWVKQLQAEKEDVCIKLAETETEATGVRDRLTQVCQQLEETRRQVDTGLKRYETKQLEIQELKEEIERLKREISLRDGCVESLKHDLNLLYEKIEKGGVSERRDKIVAGVSDTYATPTMNATPQSKVVDAGNIESQLSDKSKLVSQLQEALKELEEERVTKVSEITRLETETRVLSVKCANAESEVKTLTALVSDRDSRISVLETRLKETDDTCVSLKTQVAEHDQAVCALKWEVDSAKKTHTHTLNEMEQLRSTYRFVVDAHSADLKRLEELRTEREELITSVNNLKADVARLESDKRRERADFDKYMAKANFEIERLKTEKDEIEKDLQSFSKESGPTEGSPDKVLQTKYDSLRKRSEMLRKQLDEAQLEVTQHRVRNESLESMVTQLETKLSQNNESVRELRRKLQSQSALLSPDFIMEKTVLERQVHTLTASKELLETRLKDAEAMLEQERRSQLPMRSRAEELSAQVSVLNEEITRLKAADIAWQEQYTSLLSSYNGIEPQSVKLKEDLKQKESELAEIKTSLATSETEMKKRLETIQKLQSVIQSKDRQLKETTSQMANAKSEHESTIETLKQSNSTLQSKLSELESNKTEDGVEQLQNQLDALRRANELLRQQRTKQQTVLVPNRAIGTQTETEASEAVSEMSHTPTQSHIASNTTQAIPPGLLDAVKQLARLAARQYVLRKSIQPIVRHGVVNNSKKRQRLDEETSSEPSKKKVTPVESPSASS
eukprot:Blabericola_migrator_1__6672@NODE_336_length_9641_cov_148_260497_g271_i0_p1_GENE_NODE_336_length_9641_cov_148_260497_g271_i0NODE_336_length_9641_cov_148_260497_g271_i0_p1_ORF_typecomplete_len1440_score480_03Fez1/PF06818_15/1_9Fez1/PF06818_15/20Fez1/PF06818_15/0_074Fez1/PF06818_15/2_3e03Fez1/PF06818_15/0_17Fez1/PF06818_15/0_0019Fez1/PF06818_15/1_1Fez1/PF06818_15/0_00016HOOK/PF05622_12/1_6HOOK/PF05622_12/0_032HOOK/PF05622_12/0_019HOOK/PF05622_12/9_9e07HOOK/PF05622_12/1_1HOOK/PF05622_12/2_8Myosin_t